jgi:hypothetical protein
LHSRVGIVSKTSLKLVGAFDGSGVTAGTRELHDECRQGSSDRLPHPWLSYIGDRDRRGSLEARDSVVGSPEISECITFLHQCVEDAKVGVRRAELAGVCKHSVSFRNALCRRTGHLRVPRSTTMRAACRTTHRRHLSKTTTRTATTKIATRISGESPRPGTNARM